MKRTKLADRKLPDYTRAEEIMNMVTHIVGGALGVAALVLCVVFASAKRDAALIVGSAIYGVSLIALYTMSSVYHGLKPGMAKKVMQVIDHCTIYFLIGGTYTPIVLGPLRKHNPALGWTLFGIVWGLLAVAIVFTAIDWKKYNVLSMIAYICVGWCIIFAVKPLIEAISVRGFWWILGGGIAYTVGSILYGIGSKKRYFHSVFHIFVLAGSILQFFGILFHVIGV